MKLVWNGRYAEAHGWHYAIQTEQIRGERPWHSLLVKAPGWTQYNDPHQSPHPPIPDIGLRAEGTFAYVKREAQAHANLVKLQIKAGLPVEIHPMPL